MRGLILLIIISLLVVAAEGLIDMLGSGGYQPRRRVLMYSGILTEPVSRETPYKHPVLWKNTYDGVFGCIMGLIFPFLLIIALFIFLGSIGGEGSFIPTIWPD